MNEVKNVKNEENIMHQYLQMIVDAYQSGINNSERGLSLRQLSEEFDITLMKVRKLLITAGVYSSEISDSINQLKNGGKTIEEIMQITRLSRASVHSYLPYTKSIYNTKEISMYAERCRIYRERKNAVTNLKQYMNQKADEIENILWTTVLLFVKYTFITEKGVKFRYIENREKLFIIGTDTSITRNTVNAALDKVLEKGRLSETEWSRFYGGEYLEAIFKRLGIFE